MALIEPKVNFGKVLVSTGYDASATSIVLNTGDGAILPNPSTDGDFRMVWWNSTDYGDPSDDPNVEIVLVTARSTDTLTVVRAFEGTTASTKNTASKEYRMAIMLSVDTMKDVLSNLGDQNPQATVLGSISQPVVVSAGGKQRISIDANGNIIVAEDFVNISNSVSGGSVDVTAQTSDAANGGLAFNVDGTKMYVVASSVVYQYTLSTAWDVTTATYDSVSQSLSTNDNNMRGIFFKPDGTKMFLTGGQNDSVYEYALSTPWSITTASLTDSFAPGFEPYGLHISPDGRYFYVCLDTGSDLIYQGGFKEAWDLTTAYIIGSQSASSNNANDVCLNPTGTKLYLLSDFSPEGVVEYSLSTPWDISSMSQVQTFVLPGDLQRAIYMTPQGDRWFRMESSNGTIEQYDMLSGGNMSVGALTVRTNTAGNVILNGGNAYGAAISIGTTDDQAFQFLQNNVAVLQINVSGQVQVDESSAILFHDSTNPFFWINNSSIGSLRISSGNNPEDNVIADFRTDGVELNPGNVTGQSFTLNGQASQFFTFYGNGWTELSTSSSPTAPSAVLGITSFQRPEADLNDTFDYNLVLRYGGATTGASQGIGFSVTNTTGNVGAAIIHRRTGGNSLGTLEFYTKRVTTGAADPSLALTIGDDGVCTFVETPVIPTFTPASASATGVAGQIAWDGSFIYVCTATNTWVRAALATW